MTFTAISKELIVCNIILSKALQLRRYYSAVSGTLQNKQFAFSGM